MYFTCTTCNERKHRAEFSARARRMSTHRRRCYECAQQPLFPITMYSRATSVMSESWLGGETYDVVERVCKLIETSVYFREYFKEPSVRYSYSWSEFADWIDFGLKRDCDYAYTGEYSDEEEGCYISDDGGGDDYTLDY